MIPDVECVGGGRREEGREREELSDDASLVHLLSTFVAECDWGTDAVLPLALRSRYRSYWPTGLA